MKWEFSKQFGRQMANEVSKRFNIKRMIKLMMSWDVKLCYRTQVTQQVS
jgi:hypothetical protein